MAVNLDILLNDKEVIQSIQKILREAQELERAFGDIGDKGERSMTEIGKGSNKLRSGIQKVVKETDKLNRGLKDGMKGADKAVKDTTRRVNKLDRAVDKAGKSGKKASIKLGGGFKKLAKTAALTVTSFFAFDQVIELFRTAINVITSFDSATANLAGVLGKSTDEIKALTDQAKELGATTSFTAAEITALQTELAKLGFSETEIIDSTAAIQNLAVAAGGDLSRAASLAGSTLRAFELDASEAGRVVDVIAKSFTISALDINKFETAIASVAPVANSAGVSIEETTALLGTLVDAGIDASTAGTGLRNVFLEVAKEGTTVEAALSKIRNAADKNAVALDLFGKRGATVGTILANNTDKANLYTQSLESAAGASQKLADAKLDTISGQFTLLRSAFEGFILSLDDGNGALSKLIRNATNLATQLLSLLTSNEKLNNSFEASTEAIRDENLQAEALFSQLKSLNTEIKNVKKGTDEYEATAKAKNKVLGEINEKYGKYLPNLLTQKSSLKEIEIAQNAVNKSLLTEQIILQKREELAPLLDKRLELTEELIKAKKRQALAEGDVNKLLDDALEGKVFSSEEERFAFIENFLNQFKNADLQTEGVLRQVRNVEKEIGDVNEKFNEIASEIGVSLNKILGGGDVSGGSATIDETAKKTSKELEKLIDLVNQSAKKLEREGLTDVEKILFDEKEAKKVFDPLINALDSFPPEKRAELQEKLEAIFAGIEEDVRVDLGKLVDAAFKEDEQEFSTQAEKVGKVFAEKMAEGFQQQTGDRAPEFVKDVREKLENADNPFDALKAKLQFALNLDNEEFAELEAAVTQTFNSIFEGISAGIDAQIDEQDRLIQSIREREEAVKESLEIEQNRAEKGYANNVDAKKAELEAIQEEEEEAQKKKTELLRKQAQIELAINTAQQAANLATAVSKIFSANASTPFVGIALAAAAVASMFSLFQQFKAQSQQASALYEGGSVRDVLDGYVDKGGQNDKHAQGYRVIDNNGRTRMRLGGSEMVMNEFISRQNEPFLKDLNAGKYNGIDITKSLQASMEPVRLAGQSNTVIMESQKEKYITKKEMEELFKMHLSGMIDHDKRRKEVKQENGKKVVRKQNRERRVL